MEIIQQRDFPICFLRGKKEGANPRKHSIVEIDSEAEGKLKFVLVQPPMMILAQNSNDMNTIASSMNSYLMLSASYSQAVQNGSQLNAESFETTRSMLFALFSQNAGFWDSENNQWKPFSDAPEYLDEFLNEKMLNDLFMRWVDLCLGPLPDGKLRMEFRGRLEDEYLSSTQNGKDSEITGQSSLA